MSEITTIALSGAVCSGKNSAVAQIKNLYSEKGYSVQLFYSLESSISQNDDGDKPVLRLYILSADALSDMSKDNLSNLMPLWDRFDAVIYLESCLLCDDYCTDCYDKKTAINEHSHLLDLWVGHPHLRYIKTTDTIDEKINLVCEEIDCVLANIEIEKKFLIEYPNVSSLEKYKPFKAEIEQTYLLCNTGSHRIRKRGLYNVNSYYETLKIRINGSKCKEFESIIDENRYNNLMQLANPEKNTIVKDRYYFIFDGQYFEMDVYPFWNDKAVVELELKSENQSYTLPPEIKVIKDVSNSKKYKNNYLASLKL